MFQTSKNLTYIRSIWPKGEKTKTNLKLAKKYNDIVEKENKNSIDDQTWYDLDMDSVFPVVNKTITTPGEHVLYNMLRTPLYDEKKLKDRDTIISLFQENASIRENLQLKLLKIGKQKFGDVLSLLWDDLEENNFMRILTLILGTLPLVLIVLSIFFGLYMIAFIFPIFLINMTIHYKSTSKIQVQINSISYFSKLINGCKYINTLDLKELSHYKSKLDSILKKVKTISSNSSSISRIEGIDVLGDYFATIFLFQERAYYKIIKNIKDHRNDLRDLYNLIGEMDAFISIAAYRECLPHYSKPEFVSTKKYFQIKDAIHPLIEKAVPNSITLNKSGVILTGTNMAGKSTFLRTVGLNALMAQTFYTCTAKEYVANFFNIVSSMAPKDNVLKGKSYYLGEAEAILRIINKVDEEPTVLCVIDEIFRGTNPVERVAASAEILQYIIDRNCIPIVATHDHELTKLLKGIYKCYYFSEDVDEKEGLKFDYKIKEGVSPTTNAIKLLNYVGYPKKITEGAYTRVKKSVSAN
ncbi:MutS-related protein [Clostridium oceanicum]|uniref:MutS family DNA mismatch repair protein n=1 Tax=Clostridium oceanicum TaxID=1543 RepID=A0ABP3V4J2_9CLOT